MLRFGVEKVSELRRSIAFLVSRGFSKCQAISGRATRTRKLVCFSPTPCINCEIIPIILHSFHADKSASHSSPSHWIGMLQPRTTLSRPSICRQCFHTFSKRLLPAAEAQKFKGESVARNQELDIGYRPEADLINKEAILRTYKPRTPGLRNLARPINDHLYKGRPYLPLTIARKGQHIGGRNRSGQVTVRHRGGGAKRRIRTVDFSRIAPGRHFVERIEHDPGRSAHIALLTIRQGETKNYSYIVAPQGMRAGETVESFRSGLPEVLRRETEGTGGAGLLTTKTVVRGNCLPLHMIPAGATIFCVGLRKDGPAQLCRSAGTFATVIGPSEASSKWIDFVDVKLKSGEVRRLHKECCATVGIASNVNFHRRRLGKAGRSRHLGIRPTVRGVAMNASEHPHGGGRGKSKGNRPSMSIWGQLVYKLLPLHIIKRQALLTNRGRQKEDSRLGKNPM